ncbi:MAG TPA: DUF1668 domain-containing protein [Planctomicrobium sp.]|nr:DUF1668 domain-containing protein [Planctomicrobium sp.]
MHRRNILRLGTIFSFTALSVMTAAGKLLADQPPAAPSTAPSYAELPEGIASFGAAQEGDWLYVYGGHTGRTHTYSKQQALSRFQRISLKNGGNWEVLPSGPGLQGLVLLAHKGSIYRIGGMTARNEPGEKQDLYSLADFAKFDPQTKAWTELPPLPEGRSSHGASIVGDKLYVVGGWRLNGSEEPQWQSTMLVFDLAAEKPEWQTLPTPPFQRRALMSTALNGKIYVTGGLTPEGAISRDVDVFDTQTQTWSKGPAIPGMPMNGNGLASYSTEKALYISGMDGKVYRLNKAQDGWDAVGRLEQPRIHHRLASLQHGVLLAIAGATMQDNLKTITPVKFDTKH